MDSEMRALSPSFFFFICAEPVHHLLLLLLLLLLLSSRDRSGLCMCFLVRHPLNARLSCCRVTL